MHAACSLVNELRDLFSTLFAVQAQPHRAEPHQACSTYSVQADVPILEPLQPSWRGKGGVSSAVPLSRLPESQPPDKKKRRRRSGKGKGKGKGKDKDKARPTFNARGDRNPKKTPFEEGVEGGDCPFCAGPVSKNVLA